MRAVSNAHAMRRFHAPLPCTAARHRVHASRMHGVGRVHAPALTPARTRAASFPRTISDRGAEPVSCAACSTSASDPPSMYLRAAVDRRSYLSRTRGLGAVEWRRAEGRAGGGAAAGGGRRGGWAVRVVLLEYNVHGSFVVEAVMEGD